MIDFHSHTLLSDGVLLPSELVQRARAKGYRALAITDHVDASNIADVTGKLKDFVSGFTPPDGFTIIPGVELTHVPPDQIGGLVKKARSLGARLVLCHGETIVEPVAKGTNEAAIEAGVDILAHPGLISEELARRAAERGIIFELSCRKGHSLTNGHVARIGSTYGVEMVINTDAHAPGDLVTVTEADEILTGAGLQSAEIDNVWKDAEKLLEKISA